MLLLFNIVVISISLLTHTSCASADSVTSKKQYQTQINKKTLNTTNDVWERVRLGMQISLSNTIKISSKKVPISNESSITNSSKPTPEIVNTEAIATENEKQPKELVTSNYITQPHTAVAPINNYTDLGFRIRFGTDKPQSNGTADQQQVAEVKKQEPQIRHEETAKKNPKKAIIDERINKQITAFSQNPVYLYRVTERARPYLYSIVEELSKKQLPLELALLPIVESAYLSSAQSPKGAAGIWQFMPATGNDYGLKQNAESDDRLDILASTRAAIHFLSDLKTHFKGDWLLALAAYNCGQGAVDNAISKNITDGLDTDFWSLRLPKETQDYVPRLLALSNIFANPANYGLKFAPIKNEPI